MIKRRKTREVKIGDLKIGKNNPVYIQSMTNTDTKDASATIKQILELEKAGCEIIRVSVPDMQSAKALLKIKKKIHIPLVADIHFDWKLAVESIKNGADKIRINPGNIGDRAGVEEIVKTAKKHKASIRVGINSGSLEKDLLKKYKDKATPEGLAESAIRSVKLLEEMDFENIVISLKSSDVLTTIKAHKILRDMGDWPFHLGITEAGRANAGVIKSSLGIGGLLLGGIGDTIRVSLSGPPKEEVKVGWEIVKNLKLRERGLSIISCPTCARTKIPVEKLAKLTEAFEEKIGPEPFKIAIMGCIVNGLGEAKEADFAIVGIEKGKASIFEKGKFVQNIEPQKLTNFLKKFLQSLSK